VLLAVGGGTRPAIAGNWVVGYAFTGMWDVGYGITGIPVIDKPLPASRAPSTVDILINSCIFL
jgi:hypothetical protein